MAQKKTASSRGGTRKSTSTARKGTTAKKKTTSAGRGSQTRKKTAPARGGNSRAAASRTAASRSRSRSAVRYQTRQDLHRQVGCGVLMVLGIIAGIGYFPANAWLVVGIRRLIMGFFGWGFYITPVCLLWGAGILGLHRERPAAARVACVLLLPAVFGAFIHALAFPPRTLFSGMGALDSLKNGFVSLWKLGSDMSEHCGGILGGVVGTLLKKSIGVVGSFLLLLLAFGFMLLEGMSLSVLDIMERLKRRPHIIYDDPEEEGFSPDEFLYPEDDDEDDFARPAPPPVSPPAPAPAASAGKKQPAAKKPARRSFYDQNREQAKDELFAQFDVDPAAMARVTAALDAQTQRGRKPAPAKETAAPKKPVSTARTPAPTQDVAPLSVEEAADIAGVQIQSADMDEGAASPPEKLKINKDAEAAAVAREIEQADAEDKPEYVYPPVELLNSSGDASYEADGDLDETEAQLENAVRSFGVGASVVGAVHGPTITRYELKLEQGVKLNKITNLAGDIALSLGVKSVRIAPVPDKISTVGVEVPNKNVRTVWLGDLVDSDEFRNSKNKLCVALGKDIGGNVIVSNLAKMPHLLIAGTTGSGKSVCVNSMILSLLYKSTPDEVRMIMIDPKMVEFVVYNGMPHLYVPVVTDAKKAAGALQWAVVEMLKRYRLFSEAGVRELSGYNTIMKNQGEPTLPQVVIFIDELADLMMVASKEVEESVCRVAQMGRAAGMHLVIATQSPRADVITGLMKANIPSRIALSVSGPLESRIILDQQGAEKLLGNGDMLYSPIGSKPIRLQGAFVTDEEREEIINFVKKEAEAEYSDEILAEIEKAAADKDAKNAPAEEESAGGKSDYDELLPQAVDVIFETKQASVSMLQRRLKLGYSRAARLIDQLEEVGVVGPYEGSKPRQIVMTKQQWQEMQYIQGTAPVDTIAREFAQVTESDQFAPAGEPPVGAADVAEGDDGEPPFELDEEDGGEDTQP